MRKAPRVDCAKSAGFARYAGIRRSSPSLTLLPIVQLSKGAPGKTQLRSLWQHPPYFHDGSAATLPAVVEHYNRVLDLNLSDEQKEDLVEFLRSL